MEQKRYMYEVRHRKHGEVSVTAEDKLHAVTEAAHIWGCKWTDIARQCDIRRLGEVPGREPPKRKIKSIKDVSR